MTISHVFTGAEMAAIRSGLGLTRPQQAKLLETSDRTIQYRESDTHPASPEVCDDIRELDALATQTVERITAALAAEAEPQLAIPSGQDPGSPLPPAWYQAIAARARHQLPSLRIIYREPAVQNDPGLSELEIGQLRQALDANLLGEQVDATNLAFALHLPVDETGQRMFPHLLAKARTWSPEQAAAALKQAGEAAVEDQVPEDLRREETGADGQAAAAQEPSSPDVEDSELAARRNANMYQALTEEIESACGLDSLDAVADEIGKVKDMGDAFNLSDEQISTLRAALLADMYQALIDAIRTSCDMKALYALADKVKEVKEGRDGLNLSDEQVGTLRAAFVARRDELAAGRGHAGEPGQNTRPGRKARKPKADAATGSDPADTTDQDAESQRPADALGVDAVDGVLVGYPHELPEKTRTLVQILDSAARLDLGAPMVEDKWRRHDGIVYVSDAAATLLKLPKTPPKSGPVIKALTAAGWNLGQAGLTDGYSTIYRGEPKTTEHVSLRLVIVPYLRAARAHAPEFQLMGADEDDGTPQAARLARRQILLSAQSGTPMLYTPAVTGIALLKQRRPAQVPERNPDSSYKLDGDRKRIMRQAERSVEAGGAAMPYPVLHSAHPDAADRDDKDVAQEEDYLGWARILSDLERARPCAVSLDVMNSFASVIERLPVPLGTYQQVDAVAAADAGTRLHGFGYADLSGIQVEPELPHFASPSGLPPEGPRPYCFQTLKYARTEYGWNGQITNAWITDRVGALFEAWWPPLREVILDLMSRCGVTPDLTGQQFLDAYAAYKTVGNPDTIALIAMNKSLYKAGIGKLREGPRSTDEEDFERWLAKIATDPWHRPDIRAYVLSAARLMAHRRFRKTLQLTGRAPFAVWHDAAVYATDAPSPLEITQPLLGPDGKPITGPDGKPITGNIRLGVRPGCMKLEGWAPLADLLKHTAETGYHPASLIKTYKNGIYTGKEVPDDDE